MSDEIERLPHRLAFAGMLERVMRHLHPPHASLPGLLRPQDLGLPAGVPAAGDPLLAYRYLRGLEQEGQAAAAGAATAWWRRGHALLGPVTALEELRPGLLALGTRDGAVHLASAERGEWELTATLNAGPVPVNALAALSDDELLVLAGEGFLGIVDPDPAGRWRRRAVNWAVPAVGGFDPRCACRLAEGQWLVGGHGGEARLQRLPSGEWSATWRGGSHPQTLVPLPGAPGAPGPRWLALDGYPSSGPPMVYESTGEGGVSGRSLGVTMEGGITAAAPWAGGQGLALGSGAGELLLLTPQELSWVLASNPPSVRPERMASTAIMRLRALPGGRLLTGHADGQQMLWRAAGSRLVLLSELPKANSIQPAQAMLCDGRLAMADGPEVDLVAPDAGGVWRAQRLFTASNRVPKVGIVLGGKTLACAAGRQLQWLEVDDLVVRQVATADLGAEPLALQAPDGDTLAALLPDGYVQWWRRTDGQGEWTEQPSPLLHIPDLAPDAPLPKLATSRGHALRAVASTSGEPIWRLQMATQGDAGWQTSNLPRPSAGTCHAIAIDDDGGCAVAIDGQIWLLQQAGWVVPSGLVARHWLPDGLHAIGGGRFLAIDLAGQCTLVTAGGLQPVALPWLPGGLPLRSAVAAGGYRSVGEDRPALLLMRGASGLLTAAAEGAAAMATPVRLSAFDVRGPVAGLHARGPRVVVSAEMLYLVDLQAPPEVGLRSLSLEDGVAVACALAPDGAIRRLQACRLDGLPWTTRLAGGRAEPDDPLLARHVALQGRDGRLDHLGRAARYSFSADRTVFTAEDAR